MLWYLKMKPDCDEYSLKLISGILQGNSDENFLAATLYISKRIFNKIFNRIF